MFAVKFNVDVAHDINDDDGDTSAYLVFEREFKTKSAAEKWAMEHFRVEEEFKDDKYFVAPTPYGHGHDRAMFWIEIVER